MSEPIETAPSPDPATAPESLPESAEPAPPAPRYLVGVLYYGAVDREHDRCMKALHDHPYIADVMELTGCPYIDMGRSIIATTVLDRPGIDGLLFIDHDMVFEPSEVEKVIESAQASRGVVGAAYSMRRPGRIIGAIDGSKLEPGKQVVFFNGGEPVSAHHLGMGMTAIHRSVLERLVAASEAKAARQRETLDELTRILHSVFDDAGHFTPLSGPAFDAQRPLDLLAELAKALPAPDLPRLTTGISDAVTIPFFSHLQRLNPQCPPGTVGVYVGEDVSFCLRCHEANVPVQVDTRARVYHKGAYCYGLEDVGMQVPYIDRLEVVDTGAREPVPKAALFSTDPTIQKALDEAYPNGALVPRALGPLPEVAEL